MSHDKHDNIQFWLKRIINFFRQMIRRIVKSVLRLMMLHERSPRLGKTGFVLPTVTMVMLVVVILTTAIFLRSFDRVQDARNVRVNQALLSSATPALYRAYAKLEEILRVNPPTTTTPSEDDIETPLTEDDRYTFGDEDVLEVSFNGDTIKTAWRFPVDTNNNGKFDSYTLYGIFLRTPDIGKKRTPLQSRTPPYNLINASSDINCSLGGRTEGEWQLIDGKLKKSFFVYVVTVPITETPTDTDKYETFKGTTGVSALEYQQDWERIPLINNAVVYEDDLEISPAPAFNLNGRIITNSNLIVSPFSNSMRLYLVSSKESCFFDDPENSKIVVGGNLINGQMGNNTEQNAVKIDLFQGAGVDPKTTDTINSDTQSVNVNQTTDASAAYNTQAYANTIDSLADDSDPNAEEFYRKRIRRITFQESPNGDSIYEETTPVSTDDFPASNTNLYNLIYPTALVGNDPAVTDPTNSNDKLTYKATQPPATNPDTIENEKEDELGDRIKIGNGLPFMTWNGSEFQEKYEQTLNNIEWTTGGGSRTRTSRVEELPDVGSTGRDGFWEEAAATAPEDILEGEGGLRVVTGAGVYERRNSFLPPPQVKLSDDSLSSQYPVDYNEDGTFAASEMYDIVWPDTMPMSPGPASQVYDNINGNWQTLSRSDWNALYDPPSNDLTSTIDPKTKQYAKGDLRMRATAVYHYAVNSRNGDTQVPIACVSSYYDNSDYNTDSRASNNGVVYPFPSNSLTTFQTELEKQADYVFPNGRFVNENLKKAADKNFTGLTLAEQSSVDATVCALSILSGATASEIIPNDAIKELALLNARAVKAIEADKTSTTRLDETFTIRKRPKNNATADDAELTSNYSQPLEERYPLEIRLTQIDLNVLRKETVSDTNNPNGPKPEYLLPNSGIIYATRDDAIPDRSSSKIESPTDYKLDPSRRPSGILLINGKYLARNDNDNDGQNDSAVNSFLDIAKEKGLILVSDLPVYIKGEFNIHDQEEFIEVLNTDANGVWSNFYSRDTRNNNFACRKGDSRCGSDGDGWRAATVLADSVNLVSDNFRFGYRNEGDFDLRNNAGDVIVRKDANGEAITAKKARRKNGFLTNSFVTTGLSSRTTFNIDETIKEDLLDSNYSNPSSFNSPNPGNNLFNSSYFNNFVTPVQRRLQAREYVMEMCRKFPLSSCGPADWVTGYDQNQNGYLGIDTFDEAATEDINGNGITGEDGVSEVNVYATGLLDPVTQTAITNDLKSDINTKPVLRTWLGAGTTAKSPLEPNPISTNLDSNTDSNVYPGDQRFPRRVAFKRNPFHQLELDGIGSNYTVKPLGIVIDGTNKKVDDFSYKTPNIVPRNQSNALWFRTTNNATGQPDATGDMTYVQDRLPYYYFDDNGDGNKETINNFLTTADSKSARVLLPKTAKINNVSLDEADDYSVCTNDATGQSQNYNVESSKISGDCDSTALTKIGNASSGFIKGILDITTSNLLTDAADIILPQSGNTVFGDDTWVYDLPGTIGSSNNTIITLKGDENTIFVFKSSGNLAIGNSGTSTSVQMKLEGNIDPNNIFWVVGSNVSDDGNIDINNGSASSQHLLTGNFLGTGTLTVGNNTRLLGSRILGFSRQTLSDTNTTITAMSTQDQPLLVPVLQIHVPKSTNTNTTLPVTNQNNQGNKTYWMPPPKNTEFNLVVGARDIPSRPQNGTIAVETNGGLQNLPRFLENWQNPLRSTKIFGSFIQLGRSNYATAPYLQIQNTASPPASIFPDHSTNHTLYSSGTASGRIAYQGPPERNWGFDVGLLFQAPDLFAKEFTVKTTDSKPDEYFREVGTDDDWVKGLLCSKVEEDGNNAIDRPTQGENDYYCDNYE